MSERILPDVNHRIQLTGGEDLLMNGAFDSIMYYEPLDAWWVRYWDSDDKDMKMVVIKPENAQVLLDETDLPYTHRETIFESEHKLLTVVLGKWVTESMFDLDIDEQAIIDEFKNSENGET